MIKFGILGVESTHTDLFLRNIRKRENVKVTAISAEDEALLPRFKERHPELDCAYVEPERLCDYADAIVVTVRDGAKHLDFIKRCARRGIPVWIDKPFTASVSDAEELVSFFEENDIPFCGGTSVKYSEAVQGMKKFYEEHKDSFMSANLCFRIHINSPYSGIHFYAPHLIESMLEVFGTDVRTVYSKLTGENLCVTVGYEKFNVILNYAVETMPFPYAAFSKDSTYLCSLTPEMMQKTEDVEFEEFIEVIESGKSSKERDFFITAVKVCCAIIKSINEKREICFKEM